MSIKDIKIDANYDTPLEEGEDVIEQRELNLSNPEDLDFFLLSAEDVFAESRQYEEIALIDNYVRLDTEDITGVEIYETLYQKFTELKKVINQCSFGLTLGESDVDDSKIEYMQLLYDDMIAIRNHVRLAYQDEVEVFYTDEQPSEEKDNNSEEVVSVSEKVEEVEVERKDFYINEEAVTAAPEVLPISATGSQNEVRNTEVIVPDEADLSILIKRIKANQFYTAEEKNTALTLYENFHRGVAENISVSETLDNYKKLNEYIEKLESNPEIKYINQRVCRILERVTTGKPSDVAVVEAVKAKCNKIILSHTQEGISYSEVYNLYQNLEQYVKIHEREWLTVCGLNVPTSGREGVSVARALREGLMVSRDRHKELLNNPEKKIFVDTLIRKLANIPKEGLSEKEVLDILALVRRIDVPSSFEFEKIKPQEESKNDSDESREVGDIIVPTIKRKTMEIVSDDTEKVLSISVEKRSENRLSKVELNDNDVNQSEKQLVTNIDVEKGKSNFISKLEAIDPVNTVVPEKRPTIIHSREVHQKRSLTKEYLTEAEQINFINNNFKSLAAFEKILDMEVTKFEAKSVDGIERWLNEERASPFVYIQDMTIFEVEKLGAKTDLRAVLVKENIKYETFVEWLDRLQEMQNDLGENPKMKFGELYARWMLHDAMEYSKEEAAA